jgi:hypothetical protein
MKDIGVELDRAYLVGVLRGVHTCKKIYMDSDSRTDLEYEFDNLMSLIEADIAMAQPTETIGRA